MYRDDGLYEILIDSDSIIVKQKFSKGTLFYETIAPLIGKIKRGDTFLFDHE